MWEIRRKLSLLLAHGHPDAGSYPLGFMSDEASLIVERTNALMATEGTIIQAAAAAVMTKEGGKHFQNVLASLVPGD
jgi:hypothetical protein